MSDRFQIHCQSATMYRRYLEAVTSSCDRAMRRTDPAWRHPYHATALDAVLAISLEIDKYHNCGPIIGWPNTNVLAEISRSHETSASPSSFESSASEEIIYSASSATSPSSPIFSSPRPGFDDSAFTSPTTIHSGTSPSTTPSNIPSINPLTAICDCGKIFSGIYCVTNMQRHRRSSSVHGSTKLQCKVPGCESTLGRSDNLRKHFRIHHPQLDYPDLQRQGAVKRKRGSSDQLGRKSRPAELS